HTGGGGAPNRRRLDAPAARQHAARWGIGDAIAGFHVGRAADHRDRRTETGADLTQRQALGVRMGRRADDLADHHLANVRTELLAPVDAEAAEREALAELDGVEVEGHELAQPVEQDFHTAARGFLYRYLNPYTYSYTYSYSKRRRVRVRVRARVRVRVRVRIRWWALLISGSELAQEAHVVGKEQPDVVDLVAQHGHAFHAHA